MDQLPAEIGKYRVECELGRGGMGVVYRAFDRVVERPVAIKTLSSITAANSADPHAQLRREAKAIGQLEHPNIVSLYDAGEINGMFYLVMQLVHGESLHQRMARRATFSVREILEIFQQLLDALAYAHSRGVVHRDIKPSNIMLTPEGLVKLTDFGVAKIGDSRISSAGLVVGTPSYMSPEQILGQTVDPRSDIFALGCILYELVTGKKAFGGGDTTSTIYKIVHEPPTPPNVVFPEIHPGLDVIILKTLAKAPAERFSSCGALRRHLEACINREIPVATSEAIPPPRRPAGTGNGTLAWASLAAGIVGTLLLSAQVIRSPRSRPATPLQATQPLLASVGTKPPVDVHREDPVAVPIAPSPVEIPLQRPHKSRAGRDAVAKLPDLPIRQSRIELPLIPPAVHAPVAHPEPPTFSALMLQGDLAFQRNRYAEALARYSEAASRKPADPGARRKISLVMNLLGRGQEARPSR